MALVYIEAQAPWGPIRLRVAAHHGDMLSKITTAPAHVVDVGERDPVAVIAEAERMMVRPDALGWIRETVVKASNFVVESISRVSATHVASTPADAAPGGSGSHSGAMASNGEAEPEFCQQYAPVREVEPVGRPRRPSAEVDAKAIRAGLGLSQPAFSKAFGIPLATLRDWEQGRNKPEGATRVLLMTINLHPEAVREAAGRVQALGSGQM